jgi:hypothetical protein
VAPAVAVHRVEIGHPASVVEVDRAAAQVAIANAVVTEGAAVDPAAKGAATVRPKSISKS